MTKGEDRGSPANTNVKSSFMKYADSQVLWNSGEQLNDGITDESTWDHFVHLRRIQHYKQGVTRGGLAASMTPDAFMQMPTSIWDLTNVGHLHACSVIEGELSW